MWECFGFPGVNELERRKGDNFSFPTHTVRQVSMHTTKKNKKSIQSVKENLLNLFESVSKKGSVTEETASVMMI